MAMVSAGELSKLTKAPSSVSTIKSTPAVASFSCSCGQAVLEARDKSSFALCTFSRAVHNETSDVISAFDNSPETAIMAA